MPLSERYTVVSAVVTKEFRDRVRHEATEAGVSVSAMMGEWLDAATPERIIRAGKRQSVRRHKDELLISIPWEFIRQSGIKSGDKVRIAYGRDRLIVTTDQ